eukprot:6479656-Pyramimonas_sp.AAC.1
MPSEKKSGLLTKLVARRPGDSQAESVITVDLRMSSRCLASWGGALLAIRLETIAFVPGDELGLRIGATGCQHIGNDLKIHSAATPKVTTRWIV